MEPSRGEAVDRLHPETEGLPPALLARPGEGIREPDPGERSTGVCLAVRIPKPDEIAEEDLLPCSRRIRQPAERGDERRRLRRVPAGRDDLSRSRLAAAARGRQRNQHQGKGCQGPEASSRRAPGAVAVIQR